MHTSGVILILSALISVICGYYLHIILHETGHLLFGLISGYQFVSWRVGVWEIAKEAGGFRLKRVSSYLAPGQCLMGPPLCEPDQIPYLWYNLGGGIMNLLTAMTAVLLLHFVPFLPVLRIFMAVFAVLGTALGLINLIPLKLSGIPNDGHNILDIARSQASRNAFYVVLDSVSQMAAGHSPRDFDFTLFHFHPEADPAESIVCQSMIMEYQACLDAGRTKQAAAVLAHLERSKWHLLPVFRTEVEALIIFSLCTLEDRAEEARSRLTPELEQLFLQMNTGDKLRTLASYYLLAKEEVEKGLDLLEKSKQCTKQSALKGERLLEQRLLERLWQQYLVNKESEVTKE